MSYFDIILKTWKEQLVAYQQQPHMTPLQKMDVSLGQYRSYLVETFFNTRENPFSQVISATKLGRDQHDLFKKYVSHALAEVKHDLLALSDFFTLGGSMEDVKKLKPLPATQDLINLTYKLAEKNTPLYYLGYLFHVEFMPTQNGKAYIEILKSKGLPPESYTFLQEHVEVDVQHNKMMRLYIDKLVLNDQEMQKFYEGMNAGMDAHFRMVLSAFNRPIEIKQQKFA